MPIKMSEIGQKDRSGNDYNRYEGSAARTRPFSMEEIMLRRKSKKISGTKEGIGEDPAKLSMKGNTESASDDSESSAARKRRKGFIVGGAKKHISEEPTKESSRRKRETKENCLSKEKSNRDKSRDKLDKSEKQRHHRSKTNDDFRKEYDNKRSKDKVATDKYGEREKNSHRESKRKHHSGSDEKHKSKTDGGSIKKHDSEKWPDAEYSERKGRKKESSKSHYEEERLKRRRSRSWERERDKDRMSTSVSPKPYKRGSYNGREHGSGGSGHYRRHGGHASGLGGYSPRKRRTEAAIKTPSPTIRSPERKAAAWDLPPAGADSESFQPSHQVASSNSQDLVTPSKPNSALSPNALSIVVNNISGDSVQLTQATRPLRRLYVENLPASASDKAVAECLNDFLTSLGANRIQGTKPCISCIINQEKGQALVEFLTPEDAKAALSFDGRSFLGSVLKIRRPRDFVEAAELLVKQTTVFPEHPKMGYLQMSCIEPEMFYRIDVTQETGEPEKIPVAVDEISDIVKDSPHKIFIGGISKALPSDMLREIVGAFGVLKAYRFEANNELSESCAFLEYVDQSVTLSARAGLNGMKLGGQALTVVQAFPDASAEENTEKPPFYGIPEHAKPLLKNPTQVLKLKNVFNEDDLLQLSETELEETLEDIRLECARFGTIKSLNIVRPSESDVVASEAFETTEISNLQGSMKDHEDGDTEPTGEIPNCDSVENGSTKPPVDIEEPQNSQAAEEHNELSEDKSVNEPVKNGLDHLDSNEQPLELDLNTDYQNATVKEPVELDPNTDCHNSTTEGDTVADHPMSSNKGSDAQIEDVDAGNGSNPDNPNMGETHIVTMEASTKLNDMSLVENSEVNVDNNRIGDLDEFELGSILVEYLRKEASCSAAHCLHGRLYGERVVAASYVAYDLYRARFPR